MLGLTLYQPWASLIGWYEKAIETRSWGSDYRGLLAIHASKSVPKDDRWRPRSERIVGGAGLDVWAPFDDVLNANGVYALSQLPMGAIVAVARLETVVQLRSHLHGTQVVKAHGSRYEEAFGGFEPGRYAWIFKDVVGLERPVHCGGARGLWPVPELIEELVSQEYTRRLPEELSKNRSMLWL